MSKLSERIQEFMIERDFNQAALVRETGITPSNVSQYLSDTHTPSYKHFVQLLYCFECSADYLLGEDDLPREEPLHPVLPFGQRLREVLSERGVSQERLKRELPVSGSVIYKWLSGINQPSTESLIQLAHYLDCSVDYLIGRIR